MKNLESGWIKEVDSKTKGFDVGNVPPTVLQGKRANFFDFEHKM